MSFMPPLLSKNKLKSTVNWGIWVKYKGMIKIDPMPSVSPMSLHCTKCSCILPHLIFYFEVGITSLILQTLKAIQREVQYLPTFPTSNMVTGTHLTPKPIFPFHHIWNRLGGIPILPSIYTSVSIPRQKRAGYSICPLDRLTRSQASWRHAGGNASWALKLLLLCLQYEHQGTWTANVGCLFKAAWFSSNTKLSVLLTRYYIFWMTSFSLIPISIFSPD